MVPSTTRSPRRKRKKKPGRYHHGDLRRALLEEAVKVIQTDGVERLTLRAVGDSLGVSRSALYRHFSDKQALLASVGREGFRTFRLALADAWQADGGGVRGFEAMGVAYVQFARAHPSHYRVMFGRFVESCDKDAEFIQEATGAFKVLVDALVSLQRSGTVRKDDPLVMARFVWAVMHGVGMLVIDGQLRGVDERGETLNRYAAARIWTAIAEA